MSLTDREYLAINQARVMLRESGVWDLEEDLSCLIDRYIERVATKVVRSKNLC